MIDRKKPGVAFWITVALVAVLGLLVVYPLSYLGAAFLHRSGLLPRGAEHVAGIVYYPIIWLATKFDR
jgi:hypothetical protein